MPQEKNLLLFAKDEGYDITFEEMQAFFKDLVDSDKAELTDYELDQVAGGKTQGEVLSWVSLGIGCAIASLGVEIISGGGSCKKEFDQPYHGSI